MGTKVLSAAYVLRMTGELIDRARAAGPGLFERRSAYLAAVGKPVGLFAAS